MEQWLSTKRDSEGSYQPIGLHLADGFLKRPGDMMDMAAKECPLGRLRVQTVSLGKKMLQRTGPCFEGL